MKNLIYVFTLIIMLVSCASNSNDVFNSDLVNLYPTQQAQVTVYSHGHNLTSTSRSVNVNGNMWTNTPAYPLESEITGVMSYIASKPNGVAWPGYTNFYIQHISGAHHTYYYTDMNNAQHSMDGTQSMEMLTMIEGDGGIVHINNFNGGKCDNAATHNCVLADNGFKDIYAINEYSSSTIKAYHIFYYDGSYYIGLDYNMKKDEGTINPDGCYDDWVIKIIPTDKETPVKPNDDEPTTKVDSLKGMVETNLSINDEHEKDDYIATKLSVHVRDTTDFKIVIPVPAEYYCPQDDMYIVKTHDNFTYGSSEVTMNIGTNIVKLTITYNINNITIVSQGINADILKLLRTQYGDGLTFEIWNYYNNSISRDELKKLLDNSTIEVNTKEYINTILIDKDCIITKKPE